MTLMIQTDKSVMISVCVDSMSLFFVRRLAFKGVLGDICSGLQGWGCVWFTEMQPEPSSDVNTEHHPWSFLEKKTKAHSQNWICGLIELPRNFEFRIAKNVTTDFGFD